MEKVQRLKISPGCKTKICKKHGEYTSNELVFSGRTITQGCPVCFEENEKLYKEALNYKKNDLIEKSSIPKRFLSSSFGNFKTGNEEKKLIALRLCKKYTSNFKALKSRGTGLILAGGVGTGKTHLACSIGLDLIGRGYKILFSSSYDALRRIKDTYSSNTSESVVLKKYTECDLLIFDEIGVEYGSDTDKTLIYKIINSRYEEVLPTLIISNLSPKELEIYLGQRTFDRLIDGGGPTITFKWESYRKSNKESHYG